MRNKDLPPKQVTNAHGNWDRVGNRDLRRFKFEKPRRLALDWSDVILKSAPPHSDTRQSDPVQFMDGTVDILHHWPTAL